MKQISLYVPEGNLSLIDDLVRENYYPSRAEAIREGIRLMLKEHRKI
jgi:Arc/MetJ-type ribon-helix-helix transcriptional regulator